MSAILRVACFRIRSDLMRVNRKMKMSKMSCPLHAAAISACNDLKRCSGRFSRVTYTRPCATLTPGYTYDTEKTHCSDVKYESEGQPTLRVNCDGGVGPPEVDELKLLENSAHFLTPFQSLHVRSCIRKAHIRRQQLLY